MKDKKRVIYGCRDDQGEATFKELTKTKTKKWSKTKNKQKAGRGNENRIPFRYAPA